MCTIDAHAIDLVENRIVTLPVFFTASPDARHLFQRRSGCTGEPNNKRQSRFCLHFFEAQLFGISKQHGLAVATYGVVDT